MCSINVCMYVVNHVNHTTSVENWRYTVIVVNLIRKGCVKQNGENFKIDGGRFETVVQVEFGFATVH